MNEAIKALVAAQSEMTAAHKGKVNPAFRSKYAELSDVMDACMPALRSNGFAVLQPIGRDDHGDFVETQILHESGHAFTTRVHLILGKNDMQGFKSAVTYARRIGLGSLAGVSDTDDDGNAAAKAAPKPAQSRAVSRSDVAPVDGQRQAFRDSLDHDPETGEVHADHDDMAEGDDPPSVKDFMAVIREMAGPGATREQLEARYAAEVIANIGKRKSSEKARRWFTIFCDLHESAIGRIQDQNLRSQVRSAIALKQAQINGEKVDAADFGYPFGEPIVMGEVRVG